MSEPLGFTYQGSPARIVFGRGASAEVGDWVTKLGCRRAMVHNSKRLDRR